MRVLNIGGHDKKAPLPWIYEGWEHVLLDVAPGPDVDIVMDLKDLDGKIGYYDAVYASHVLEHIDPWYLPRVVEGISQVLLPDGWLDIRVPSLGQILGRLAQAPDPDIEMYVSGAGPVTARDLLWGYSYDIREHGDAYRHRNAFTAISLRRTLRPWFTHCNFAELPERCELFAVAMHKDRGYNPYDPQNTGRLTLVKDA